MSVVSGGGTKRILNLWNSSLSQYLYFVISRKTKQGEENSESRELSSTFNGAEKRVRDIALNRALNIESKLGNIPCPRCIFDVPAT